MRAPLILVLSVLLPVSTKPAVDAQTNSLRYCQSNGWRTSTPEDQGVNSELLAQAIETAQQRGLAIHSLLDARSPIRRSGPASLMKSLRERSLRSGAKNSIEELPGAALLLGSYRLP